MQKFIKNPIVVRDEKNEIYKLIEFSKEIGEDFSYLEVRDVYNNLINKYKMTNKTLITINKKHSIVKLIYLNKKNEITLEENLDLIHLDNENIYLTEAEEKYIIYKDLIKKKMDFPKGTEKEISVHTEMLKKSITENNARTYVMSKIKKILIELNEIEIDKIELLAYKIYSDLYGMGILQELDDDIAVGEIMVNVTEFPYFKSDIYYIKNGEKFKYNKNFKNISEVKNIFSRTISFQGKEFNHSDNAIVEATRPNKDRVNLIVPPASENWILNIRAFANFVPNLSSMKKSGTVTEFVDKLMNVLVKGKANIGIGGPMGTGKTTFVNYLLTYTPPIERKVVIASVAETDVERVLKGHDIVILNVDEEKGFTFEKLVRTSLRTTAARVIIPESRGGEFKQLYEANIKTKGNMFTGHALDAESFLDMCVDMYLSSPEVSNESSKYIKNKLCKAIDIVIIMRLVGNKIRIKSISEVIQNKNGEYEKINDLFNWIPNPENVKDGYYKRTNNKISNKLKERLNEYIPINMLEDL